MAWKTRPLGELCDITIGRTPARNVPEYWGEGSAWLSVADMNQGRELRYTKEQITPAAVSGVMGQPVSVGTVVLSFKLSIGKVGITSVPMFTNEAIAALPVKDREVLHEEFLYWALRTINLTEETDDAAMGKVLNKAKLARLQIPLPPPPEQQRIVDILNRVDRLRNLRRAVLSLVADLPRAVFLEMFGDPDQNLRGWEVKRFGSLLQEPPRNGLSPSNGAAVHAKVLTLSAITGLRFNESAYKVSTFKSTPPVSKTVNQLDFLVCRGNGNISLMGRGFFPVTDMPDTTFPDTMIAARVDPKVLMPKYLEHIWGMRIVRDQLEAAARTTNGTFKINQKALEAVDLIVPPIDEQERFVVRVQAIQRLGDQHVAHLRLLTELSASLQHRAFRDDL